MKISIITVVKNGLPFLKSAIKSIKDQKKYQRCRTHRGLFTFK